MKRFQPICLLSLVLLGGSQLLSIQKQSEPSTEVLIKQLQSSDPIQRASAFVTLEKSKGRLNSPGMQDVLLNLLDRENQLIADTLRESQGKRGISVKYGETFGEYYARVFDACHNFCDKQNPRTVEVIVNGAYGVDSVFARQLIAEYGRRVLSPLIQKSHSDVPNLRDDALTMLGVYVVSTPNLSPKDLATVRNRVIEATGDSDIGVRAVATQTLGNIGNANDMELLGRIAQRDPGTEIRQGKTIYPVRDQAQKALAKIRQRSR
jgi:hypothetical protein